MGTQIAAHLANIGLTVHLLDLPAATGEKNALVEAAFKKALKQSPPVFFSELASQRVSVGNYEEHFDRLKSVSRGFASFDYEFERFQAAPLVKLDILINGMDVRAHASQGQHKTLLISLKAGEWFYLNDHLDERPMFLLEDVFIAVLGAGARG